MHSAALATESVALSCHLQEAWVTTRPSGVSALSLPGEDTFVYVPLFLSRETPGLCPGTHSRNRWSACTL